MCYGYDTKHHLMVSLQFQMLKSVEYSFIAIILMCTLIGIGSTS